jgi:hypothetical protein
LSSPVDATPPSERILDQTEDDTTRIQFRFEDESLWRMKAQISELYQKAVKTIGEHLLNIYAENELAEDSTIRKFRIVQIEGKREAVREIIHYSLKAILAVGFRFACLASEGFALALMGAGQHQRRRRLAAPRIGARIDPTVANLDQP